MALTVKITGSTAHACFDRCPNAHCSREGLAFLHRRTQYSSLQRRARGDSMRAIGAGALAAMVIVGGLAGADAAAAVNPPTAKVVVTPVTSSGHVRTGYLRVDEPTGLVDCSSPSPSAGAVSVNIELCSPSSEYAVACWKAAVAQHVLCMRDPRSNHVYLIPRSGTFAATGLAPSNQRAPLGITLTDGVYCSIRDGGAWSVLRSHPSWAGTYACGKDGAAWAPTAATHNGVNESAASWTVQTAPMSGVGALVTRHVAKAYFVGTSA
jgi:hypothetical protein